MASSPVTEHEHAHATPLTNTAATTSAWGLFRGAVVVAIVLLFVGALAWLVFGYGTRHFVDADAKRVLEREKILADRNTEDAKLLHDSASWLAKDKGIVRVPIDRAMDMTVQELQKAQPHPAYPIKQSPPQPANAPTSPDKGAGATDATANPSASNPTVGQPSPAPAPAAPAPAPATGAPAPAPTAAAPAPVPAAAAAPAPAAPAVPIGTPPGVPAPAPDNNANNPGNPPVPGTTAAPSAAPAAAAHPEPLANPPSQPTPAGTAATPTPAPTAPVASPAGTP